MTMPILIVSWRYTPNHGFGSVSLQGNGHCQVLQGTLKETLYAWPDKTVINDGKPSPLRVTKETTYSEDEVTYMSDKVIPPLPASLISFSPTDSLTKLETAGFAQNFQPWSWALCYIAPSWVILTTTAYLHQLINKSVYTPPNLARFGCSVFSQKTGAASHLHSSHFFSEMGRLTWRIQLSPVSKGRKVRHDLATW